MAIEGNREYAFSRVEACYGRRLRDEDWRRLDSNSDLDHYLEAVRGAALEEWCSNFDPRRGIHELERSLRAHWLQYTDRVASWHAHRWQPWVRWLRWLPSLSLLAFLAQSERVPEWLKADPVCADLAAIARQERPGKLRGTALAVFEPALDGHVPIATLWRQHWKSLTPAVSVESGRLLAALDEALDRHTDRLRMELARRLQNLFRAGAGTVVATACYLGLLLLDLERLRGAIAVRQVFSRASMERST
jgi:hypothetical protein